MHIRLVLLITNYKENRMKLIAGIFLCLLAVQARAAVLTGSDFLTMCNKQSDTYPEKCIGYVAGIYEAYITFNSWELIADTLCLPDTATISSMVDVSVEQIQNQSDKQNVNASNLVLNALADSYTCNN